MWPMIQQTCNSSNQWQFELDGTCTDSNLFFILFCYRTLLKRIIVVFFLSSWTHKTRRKSWCSATCFFENDSKLFLSLTLTLSSHLHVHIRLSHHRNCSGNSTVYSLDFPSVHRIFGFSSTPCLSFIPTLATALTFSPYLSSSPPGLCSYPF